MYLRADKGGGEFDPVKPYFWNPMGFREFDLSDSTIEDQDKNSREYQTTQDGIRDWFFISDAEQDALLTYMASDGSGPQPEIAGIPKGTGFAAFEDTPDQYPSIKNAKGYSIRDRKTTDATTQASYNLMMWNWQRVLQLSDEFQTRTEPQDWTKRATSTNRDFVGRKGSWMGGDEKDWFSSLYDIDSPKFSVYGERTSKTDHELSSMAGYLTGDGFRERWAALRQAQYEAAWDDPRWAATYGKDRASW